MELGGQEYQSQRSAAGPRRILEGNVTPRWLKEDMGVTGQEFNELVPDIRENDLRYRYLTAQPLTIPSKKSLSLPKSLLLLVVVDTKKHEHHEHLALIHEAIVIPTGVVLRCPDWNVSNRILRCYSQHNKYFHAGVLLRQGWTLGPS
jgi:hypothetical protein